MGSVSFVLAMEGYKSRGSKLLAEKPDLDLAMLKGFMCLIE